MYCGFATKNNRIRWSIVFLFWLLAVLAAVGIGVTFGKCDDEVEEELNKPVASDERCVEELEDDSIRWNIGRDNCSGELPACTALGSFMLACVGALLLSTLPCCCMCCCANPPHKKLADDTTYDLHSTAPVAPPPPGGHDGYGYDAYSHDTYGHSYASDGYGYDAKHNAPASAGHSYASNAGHSHGSNDPYTDYAYSSAHVPGGPGSNVYSYTSQQYAGTLPTVGASSAAASSAAGGGAGYHHGRHGSGASGSRHGRNPSGASSGYGQSVTAAGGVPEQQAPMGGMVHTIV